MKNSRIIFIVIASLSFFVCSERVNLEVEKAEIKATLDKYHQAINEENIELLSQIIAPDEDLVWIPAAKNSSMNWASLERGWESTQKSYENWFKLSDKINYSYKDEIIKINQLGNAAWISCIQYGDEIFKNEPASFDGCRATLGLEKRKGNWIIVQGHWSFPKD